MTTGSLAAEADQESLEDSTASQFVVFIVGEEAFAANMAPVQEIIRVPDAVRVPLAPDCLDGLSNLRGRVLPLISLRKIFQFELRDNDEATRAIVIDMGQSLGFVVDRVASVIDVDETQIESAEDINSTISSELLMGLLKDVSGHSMVMLLDFDKIMNRHFEEVIPLIEGRADLGLHQELEEADEEEIDELQLVSFSVCDQEYGIDINHVQEIVQIPDNIVHVPNSPPQVLGLMTLRENMLPLMSLRAIFNLPLAELNERSRVVVIGLNGQFLGLVTDCVSEVLRVPHALVDELPTLLSSNQGLDDITRICRLNSDQRLVSVIDVETMFRQSMVRKVIEAAATMDTNEAVDLTDETSDEEQVVVFRLGDGEFGVPIESVQEIVRVPDELTHVPKAPSFVEGVINLRGTVLPVIDLRQRMQLEKAERHDRQRIMVFLLNGVRSGFIVDAVTEVLKVPNNSIEDAPKLSSEQSRVLGRVANLDATKRVIQLIEPSHLVSGEETELLTTIEE